VSRYRARAIEPESRTRDRGISEATISRLPLYHRALVALGERGVTTVSSEELAAAAGVNSAKLRKDLSHLGSYGTRGVGYDVEYLVYQISRELGLTQDWPVVIIGIGNLGRALASYQGFASRGFRIAALVDGDPALTGRIVNGLRIQPVSDLEGVIAAAGVSIGVVATPASAAQDVCDRLVAAGVRSVLNFAPVPLVVPDGVDLRRVDLATELQILAFHEQRKQIEDGHVPARRATVPGELPGAPAELSDELAGPMSDSLSGTRSTRSGVVARAEAAG
jgi:redox-sensing transcriptional repressor